ncbi:hypothetical protein ONZ51_g161 [Trametes cubensis]|uniref:Uncharacterized protein n=1 Tax=Trametes cubensis TaxID=1111947 RepID=A0AAD7U3V8_9APHY|nr:hypothetical protein ONZ51_g161 [Trametes cubensis]
MTFITVMARVNGRTPTHTGRGDQDRYVTYLDVPILPTSPIEVGSQVRVVYLEPKPREVARTPNHQREPKYTAYTSDVRGTVIGIRAVDAEVTEFILENANEDSKTKYAYMAIKHDEGTTVCLSLGMRVWRWLTLALTHAPPTRKIPIEPLSAMEWNPM